MFEKVLIHPKCQYLLFVQPFLSKSFILNFYAEVLSGIVALTFSVEKMNANCHLSTENGDFSYGPLRDLILARDGFCVIPAKIKSLANADVK